MNINSFDINERREAFVPLSKELPQAATGGNENVNLHIHSFYSYNALGWSPHNIALECKKAGVNAAGIIDFDVLDGMEEFYSACDQLELKATVGIETRTFNTLMADKEIDSPGEPGVSYIAGTGFAKRPAANTDEGKFLQMLFDMSRRRNVELIGRINAQLPDIAIDYDNDVLPLAPSGNATERHIIEAYVKASHRHGDQFAKIWSSILGKNVTEIETLSQNKPAFEELVRKKLAKQGGIGYVQPSEATFPSTADTFEWIKNCGAIPTESWLDGTSAGEQDPKALLEMSYSMGARALNIIPDRNWNIADEATKTEKVNNLKAIVKAANELGMPLHIGTEMNKLGQPFVDDLCGEVLSLFKADFVKGANIITGHVVLSRYADYGYLSSAAASDFTKVEDKNNFFASVGALQALTVDQIRVLKSQVPEKNLDYIKECVKSGNWK